MQLTEIDDELDDLETSDPLLPPDADTAGTLEVVPVHDDVDAEVEGDGNPGDGSGANQLGVAEESSRAVVVAVEEGCRVLVLRVTQCRGGAHTQRLLLEEEEDGVEQLHVLGEVGHLGLSDGVKDARVDGTYVVEDNERLGPAAVGMADGVEDALANNSGQELLNVESEETGADEGEDQVVGEEKTLELVRLAVAHPLASSKDDGVVDDDEDAGRLDGRHGRDARLESELAHGVAHDGSPDLVEKRP